MSPKRKLENEALSSEAVGQFIDALYYICLMRNEQTQHGWNALSYAVKRLVRLSTGLHVQEPRLVPVHKCTLLGQFDAQ